MNLAWRLQDLPPDDLEVLLRRRPEATELLAATELGWTKLAAQLSRPVHVAAAFDELNLFLRQVVELAAFMGGRLSLGEAAAEGLEPAHFSAATKELGRWGLAFEASDGTLALVPELRRLIWDPGQLGPHAEALLTGQTLDVLRPVALNLGLERSSLPKRKVELVAAMVARMADPAVVGSVVGQAPPQARAAFDLLRGRGGHLSTAALAGPREDWSWRWHPHLATEGPWWLVGHGLALPLQPDQGQLVIPAEVEHALRGRLFSSWDPHGPVPVTRALPEPRHPLELVAAVASMLQDLSAEPALALQQGGLPKRVIKRLAQRLNEAEESVEQLSRLAFSVGLLTEVETVPERMSRSRRNPRVLQSRQAVVSLTDRAASWEELSEPERWMELVRWVLLGPSTTPADAPQKRQTQQLLRLLSELPVNEGASAASLAPCLHWRHPSLFPSISATEHDLLTVGSALAWLGAGGAQPVLGLNAAGRLAILEVPPSPDTVGLAFPQAVDTCTVTADHRVVVAGPPSSALSRFLSRIASTESVHPARVYRLDEQSLRRGLDGGLTPAEVRAGFDRHSQGGLPQNVAAMVEDVIRRYGRLRVGPASVYVVGQDPTEIEALVRGRALRPLVVRQLAPTVIVVEAKSPDQVLGLLRKAGLMPVAEGLAPEPPVASGRRQQATAPRPGAAGVGSAPDQTHPASALARALRDSPRLTGQEPLQREADVRPAIEVVQDAVRSRRAVAIGYQRVGAATLSVVRLRPYSAEGGFLHGFDSALGTIVSLDLRRVAWAEETDETAVSQAGVMRFDFGADDDDLDDGILAEVADWER
ncbi:MAG TPA: helicase-associated domain-containing protein [Candidatus Nanopelagicaceae bacterium]|nr:helicase-associated domain-containing protein [Candidatus Nanopelagicaceae bacterium]